MSKPPLNKVLPRKGDPRKYAQQGVDLSGSVALNLLPRLRQVVLDDASQCDVFLSFGFDESHKRIVKGDISAQVSLTCQRCLAPVEVALKCSVALGIVWSEDQAQRLPKTLDPWIVDEGATDLYSMIEEELLLALPVVAYHQHQCVPRELFASGRDEGAGDKPKQNPFQVLEQLKGSPRK